MKTLLTFILATFFIQHQTNAQMFVAMIKDSLTPTHIVKEYFLGKGVVVSNVKFRGEPDALGTFEDSSRMMGFSKGIIISNGRVELVPGKNSRPSAGANFGRHFFFDEDFITKANMCDGAVLEFDFVPVYDSICFRFVFGSEEYPEFVGKDFNDAFALLLKPKTGNGKYKNIGTLPDGTTVMINNINHKRNSEWYVANDYFEAPFYDYIEYDGFTKPIVAAARVIPMQPYHLKILIADLEDCEYDSGVLLEALSFNSYDTRKPKTAAKAVTNPVDKPVKLVHKSKQSINKPIQRQYYFNFENNSYELQKEDLKKLKHLTDSLTKFAFDSIIIIGHTDSTGDEEANQLLSLNRAETIAAYFESANIKAKNIDYKGVGSSQPLHSNETEKGRSVNRRVEILFYKKRH